MSSTYGIAAEMSVRQLPENRDSSESSLQAVVAQMIIDDLKTTGMLAIDRFAAHDGPELD